MLENRRHMRIREVTDVRWAVLGGDDYGEGKVLNVSASGLMLQTDDAFDPNGKRELFIDAVGKDPLVFGAKKGRVVWSRRMPENRPGYQCGVEFMRDQGLDKALSDWLDNKTQELHKITDANILKNYIV